MITRNTLSRLLAGAIMTAPALAHAADPATPLPTAAAPDVPSTGDIIVTAQRREQSAMKVPIAITAVAGDTLTTKGITNSQNLQSAVPNLQISSPFGNAQPNFSLRGISVANEYNSNQASPIGIYLDDVYLASRTAHGMGLFDLDRVEVLRGPQGTLFGRNTTGGAINFITRAPSLSGANGYGELGYGNYNTWTGQGAVEATVIPGELGIRAAFNVVEGDGRIQNLYPGGLNPASQDSIQGRLTLRYRSKDERLDVKIMGYGGRDRPTQSGVFGYLPARTGLGFWQEDENRVGRNRSDAWGVSANISYALTPDLKLISITSRDGGHERFEQAADGSPLDLLDITYTSQFQQFSEETRLNYSAGKLNLVGGLFYGWDQVDTENDFAIGSALAPGVNGGFYQQYQQVRRSYALFSQADYEIAPRLTLTLGARYTWDRLKYENGSAYLFEGYIDTPQIPLATTVPCAGAAGTCAYDPNARYNLNGANDALTGRVTLAYQFDQGPLVFASYNRGYRSGAFNGGSYTSSSGINFVQPERINAYELGAKGRLFDRRLTYALSGFYYDYHNQQLQDLRPGPVGILVNAPKSRVFGGELETHFHMSDHLSLNGSAGYLDSRYQELSLQGANLAGNQLPFAPRWTLQGDLDAVVYRDPANSVTLSPNVTWVSHQFFSPFNNINAVSYQDNAELAQNAYAKVNAQLVWKHGNYALRLWVNNMFQQKDIAYALDLRGAGFPFNFLVPDMPRTYGVSLKANF